MKTCDGCGREKNKREVFKLRLDTVDLLLCEMCSVDLISTLKYYLKRLKEENE